MRAASSEPAWTTSTHGSRWTTRTSNGPDWHREKREREVQIATLDAVDVLRVPQGLVDVDPHVRELRRKASGDVGEQPRPDALEGPDPERPDRALVEGVDVRLGGAEMRLDRAEVAKEDATRLRQADRLATLLPLDHLGADDPLEARDLLADRGRRVAERERGGLERALSVDRLQGGEVTQVEAQPATAGRRRAGRLRTE